jgi:ATP-binding cassette subfamily F protein 3
MFQLDRVSRQYGRQVLFRDLSWQIPKGARLGLVGPNGVGKTTLLRILAGLDQPDGGAVHKPPAARIGYLPQEVETVERGAVLSVVLAGYAELAELELRLAELERRLATSDPDAPQTQRLTTDYGELRQRFEQLEGDRVEARAKAILSGLGVPRERFFNSLETLSGGWRMRVVLARLLLGSPEMLLLDEPTNHLDLDAIDWLESFLEDYEGAFIVVSHDRYFLNRMVRGIAELERGRLTRYTGNYDVYIETKQADELALEKAARQQTKQLAKTERFIERFRYKNTKARQVQSRIRELGKLERVETARRSKSIRFDFPPAPRSGDIVVRAEGVAKRYGEKRVYDRLDFLIRRADRVALVGPNGTGKSTLLKLLAGQASVDGGRLELGHNVTVHYYAQHQLEALNPEHTVLEEMQEAAPPDERPRVRRLLGCFLFSGEAVDKRVGVLSGGEKARLALARLLVRPANLLLLDEPTNHLDLDSREVLEEALNEYTGTLIVVTHDRYFINRVATSVAEVGGGAVVLHGGDYDEYLAWKQRRLDEAPGDDTTPTPSRDSGRELRRQEKRQEAEQRNLRYRQRKAVEDRLVPIEARIAECEPRLRELERLQSDPAVYADPEKAREVGREKTEVESRLKELYAKWESVAEALDR